MESLTDSQAAVSGSVILTNRNQAVLWVTDVGSMELLYDSCYCPCDSIFSCYLSTDIYNLLQKIL
jgi:hypothetical protein